MGCLKSASRALVNKVKWCYVTIIICEMFSAMRGLLYDFVHCDKFCI